MFDGGIFASVYGALRDWCLGEIHEIPPLNPFAVKPLKTRFLTDYPKCGKNYPNFGKINPLFQKDIKSGKENALQIPYKARYPAF